MKKHQDPPDQTGGSAVAEGAEPTGGPGAGEELTAGGSRRLRGFGLSRTSTVVSELHLSFKYTHMWTV